MAPFDIKRIEEMEALYDALLQDVAEIEQGGAAEAAARKTALQPEIDRLAAYSLRTGCTGYWRGLRRWRPDNLELPESPENNTNNKKQIIL